MWFLFHRNAKTRTVRDGESFVQECPECRARARFVEVEIEENVGVWFVDVVGDTSRAFKCTACGNVFDAKDKSPSRIPEPSRSASPGAAPKTAREIERDREIRALKAELARREAERAAASRKEAAEAKATQIEDELAELKKRMGR